MKGITVFVFLFCLQSFVVSHLPTSGEIKANDYKRCLGTLSSSTNVSVQTGSMTVNWVEQQTSYSFSGTTLDLTVTAVTTLNSKISAVNMNGPIVMKFSQAVKAIGGNMMNLQGGPCTCVMTLYSDSTTTTALGDFSVVVQASNQGYIGLISPNYNILSASISCNCAPFPGVSLMATGLDVVPQIPPSPSATPTPSVTPTVTPSTTPTPSMTPTSSVSPTVTPTTTPSPSRTPSPSVTPTVTPTTTPTPSMTPTSSVTPTVTPTSSSTPSMTPSPSVTPSSSVTPSITPSNTPTPSLSPSWMHSRFVRVKVEVINETTLDTPSLECNIADAVNLACDNNPLAFGYSRETQQKQISPILVIDITATGNNADSIVDNILKVIQTNPVQITDGTSTVFQSAEIINDYKKKKNNGMTDGEIAAAVVVPCVVSLLIVGAVIFFIMNRKNKTTHVQSL